MKNKQKILFILFTFITFNSLVFADNKSEVLNEISKVENNLINLKNSYTNDINNKFSVISKNFSLIDNKNLENLVGLGKIDGNFKTNLDLEVDNLNNEISSKILTELNNLSSIKNNLSLTGAVSDKEKINYLNNINSFSGNYFNISNTFSGKINDFNKKQTSNLELYSDNYKYVLSTSSGELSKINNFLEKYNEINSLKLNFSKNYNIFKNSYISYAKDLSSFSSEKQNFYIKTIKEELDKIKNLNVEANPQLKNYITDMDRLIEILVENFKAGLTKKIDEEYSIVYSENDINSTLSNIDNLKVKYFDDNSKLKFIQIASGTGVIEDLNFLNNKLTTINSNISTLIGSGNSLLYENIKIKLENQMVIYYNSNFEGYKQDLLGKIKEKLNIVSLETKNTILSSDTIDLRYSLLNDKISSSNDISFIYSQIDDFKKDVSKYSKIGNEVLNKKISNLNYNLDIFVVKKELGLIKYNKLSQSKYTPKLQEVFNKLKEKDPEYKNRLNNFLTKVNEILTKTTKTKTRFMLLCVKLNILEFTK